MRFGSALCALTASACSSAISAIKRLEESCILADDRAPERVSLIARDGFYLLEDAVFLRQ